MPVFGPRPFPDCVGTTADSLEITFTWQTVAVNTVGEQAKLSIQRFIVILKYSCPNCDALIVSMSMGVREITECKACQAQVTIPEDAEEATDIEWQMYINENAATESSKLDEKGDSSNHQFLSPYTFVVNRKVYATNVIGLNLCIILLVVLLTSISQRQTSAGGLGLVYIIVGLFTSINF